MSRRRKVKEPTIADSGDGNCLIVTPSRSFKQFIGSRPALAEAEAMLARHYGEEARPLVREWYEYMERIGWADNDGEPCRNWMYWFYTWRANRHRFAALRSAPVSAASGRRQARGDDPDPDGPLLPSRDEMAASAREVNCPEWYLDEFLGELKEKGYQYVNRGGSLVTLSRRNFKAVLGSFWRYRREHPERRDGRDDAPDPAFGGPPESSPLAVRLAREMGYQFREGEDGGH